MIQHKNQRVGIFVDVQNMYYSAKQLYGKKVNYNLLLKNAVANRQLIRAFAYAIKADMKDEKTFHDALYRIGFEVKLKDLQIFYGGAKKGDWDVGLAMDMIRLAPKLDTIILVSGDGDFTELVKYVRALGCRVEVMAFEKTCSNMLSTEADQFTNLGEKKFLL
ncbi:NYN domain-containing protein [Candidatus Woesearchaeota archaeon]|nr:NYN domain-containing protein [Candidatus Woesearchaeota archaeon]